MFNNDKIKDYKETLKSVLYVKDYENVSTNGKTYPKNRVKVELFDYSFSSDVKGELKDFVWQKVVITNSRLVLQDWQYFIKQKVVWNKIVNDETKLKLSLLEFRDMLDFVSKKDILWLVSKKDNS